MQVDTDTYAADLGSTLNNLGSFAYVGPTRRGQAEAAFGVALHCQRELAEENFDQYLAGVAFDGAYREAFSIRNKLGKSDPEAYSRCVNFS